MTAEVVTCESCGQKNRVPIAAHGIPRCGNCHLPLPWMVDADDDTFDEVAGAAVLPVLVDLWAPWCGPCAMVSPALEQLARDYAGRVKLVKVDVDQAQQVAGRLGVQGIPTLIVMKDGEVIARQTGAAPEHVLRSWLDGALAQIEARRSG